MWDLKAIYFSGKTSGLATSNVLPKDEDSPSISLSKQHQSVEVQLSVQLHFYESCVSCHWLV